MSLDYKPAILNLNQIKTWWFLPVLMVTGAIIGFLFGFLLNPTYEAVASVTTNMEITPSKEITELMLDGAINHIGELIFNEQVVNQVLTRESSAGNQITSETLKDMAAVERRLTTTLIKVRSHSPEQAARIANTWVEVFYKTLQDAYQQSLQAKNLSAYLDTLQTCLLLQGDSDPNNQCSGISPADLQEEIETVTSAIAEARNNSLGLHPYLFISQYNRASVPVSPLYYGRRALTLAGAGLGLVIALILLEIKRRDEA